MTELNDFNIQQISSIATQVVFSGGGAVLLENMDPANTVYLGSDSGIQSTDNQGIAPLGPYSSIMFLGDVDVWAVTSAAISVNVVIYPDSNTFNPSPIALAALTAVEIAEAIAGAGISFLAAPVQLYNVPTPQTNPLANLVGATVNKNTFPGDNPVQAAEAYNALLGTPCTPALQVQKQYYAEGAWPAAIPDPEAELWAQGVSLLISFKPSRTLQASERVKFANTIQLYTSTAVAGQSIVAVLWQEPFNAFDTAADFITYFQYYAPVCYNPAAYWTSGGTPPTPVITAYDMNGDIEANQITWYPGDSFTGWVMCDYYWSAYDNGATLNTLTQIANGLIPGISTTVKPMGLGEYGAQATRSPTVPTVSQWNAFTGYIQIVFTTQNSLGFANAWVLHFNGYAGGDPTAPPTNLITAQPYYIPGIVGIYLALSSTSTQTTIAPGATLTLEPIAPSPNANYAMASQFSFDLNLTLQCGSGETNPFVTFDSQWFDYDETDALPVAHTRWYMGSGTTATTIIGSGPQHGEFWQVQITNNGTTNLILGFVASGSARNVNNESLRSAYTGTVPGYTDASSDINSGILAAASIPLTAGTPVTRLLPLYSGSVEFYIRNLSPSALTACRFDLYSLDQKPVQAPELWGTGIGGIQDSPVTVVTLPKAPCYFTLTPTSGNGTVYVTARLYQQSQ